MNSKYPSEFTLQAHSFVLGVFNVHHRMSYVCCENRSQGRTCRYLPQTPTLSSSRNPTQEGCACCSRSLSHLHSSLLAWSHPRSGLLGIQRIWNTWCSRLPPKNFANYSKPMNPPSLLQNLTPWPTEVACADSLID